MIFWIKILFQGIVSVSIMFGKSHSFSVTLFFFVTFPLARGTRSCLQHLKSCGPYALIERASCCGFSNLAITPTPLTNSAPLCTIGPSCTATSKCRQKVAADLASKILPCPEWLLTQFNITKSNYLQICF